MGNAESSDNATNKSRKLQTNPNMHTRKPGQFNSSRDIPSNSIESQNINQNIQGSSEKPPLSFISKQPSENFQPFPPSFLIDQPISIRNRQFQQESQNDLNSQVITTHEKRSEPPPYELICNPEVNQHPPTQMINSNQRHALSEPTAPVLNMIPSSQQPNIELQIISNQNRSKRRRTNYRNSYYDDEYSDDPSDYESDYDKRLMYQGYYSKRDYYDKDKDYIYFKTEKGHRYKQNRW